MHVFLVVLHICIVHVILCNYAHTHIVRKHSDGLVLGGGGGGGGRSYTRRAYIQTTVDACLICGIFVVPNVVQGLKFC